MRIDVTFQAPFVIEETVSKDFIVVKGCLLAEGMTGNGHYYSFPEIKKIAKDLVGKSVRFGSTIKGKHFKKKIYEVGRVIETWVDTVKKRIIGRVKVWNTKHYPKIIETIQFYGKAMGFSIGGDAKGLVPILKNGLPILINTGHGFVAKIVGMIVDHLQIVPPNVPRGQQSAKVLNIEETLQNIELIPIEETLTVNPEIEVEFIYPKGVFRGITSG